MLATRVGYFQQQGYEPTIAVSSGVLTYSVSWVVKGALFLVAIPFAIATLDLAESPTGPGAHTVWPTVIAIVAVALVLGAVLAVPRLRWLAGNNLRPRFNDLRGQMRVLAARPLRFVQMFGVAALEQLLVVLALVASFHAFGDRLSLATLIVVITLASMLAGSSPVPGGVGAVEAGLILGLTAGGVSEQDAVAAVFAQRLFASLLPAI